MEIGCHCISLLFATSLLIIKYTRKQGYLAVLEKETVRSLASPSTNLHFADGWIDLRMSFDATVQLDERVERMAGHRSRHPA